jgi:hypothetical protein
MPVEEAEEEASSDDQRQLPCPCPRCGGRMIIIETIAARRLVERSRAREGERCWRGGCRWQQPVVTDAVETLGEDAQKEAANELMAITANSGDCVTWRCYDCDCSTEKQSPAIEDAQSCR